ncbi:MAG: hypothetical protein WB768_12875, partial [Bradyrhizobium sp.]
MKNLREVVDKDVAASLGDARKLAAAGFLEISISAIESSPREEAATIEPAEGRLVQIDAGRVE